MSTTIHWEVEKSLPEHQLMIAAVPGIGNVGKLMVDTLNEQHESSLIARILHPDMPPHSTLEGGLLTPPHLSVHSVSLDNAQTAITITGNGQPMTPRGQHELAVSILELASASNTPLLLVLAGLSGQPGDDNIHLTCSSQALQLSLIHI